MLRQEHDQMTNLQLESASDQFCLQPELFRVLFRLKDTLRLQPMFSINQLLPDSVHLWGKQEKVCNSIYVTNKRNLWSFQGCVGKCLTGSPEKEEKKKHSPICNIRLLP